MAPIAPTPLQQQQQQPLVSTHPAASTNPFLNNPFMEAADTTDGAVPAPTAAAATRISSTRPPAHQGPVVLAYPPHAPFRSQSVGAVQLGTGGGGGGGGMAATGGGAVHQPRPRIQMQPDVQGYQHSPPVPQPAEGPRRAQSLSYPAAAQNAGDPQLLPFTADDLGMPVWTHGYTCKGWLRFCGRFHHDGTVRCGVELAEPVGLNNGTVRGVRTHPSFSSGHSLAFAPALTLAPALCMCTCM